MQKLRKNSFDDRDEGEENNADEQFWKDKFPAAHGKAYHALVMGLLFLLWGWHGRDFWFFLPFFPICSP